MVERRKITTKSTPLVIVDLDGTLIRGNTFHIFTRCGMKNLLLQGKVHKLAYALLLSFMRKCRIISHRSLKFRCLPLFGDNERLKAEFTKTVKPLYNHEVERLLDDYRNSGYAILLSTAAADTYIPWLWNGDFQATKMNNNPGMIENRGEEKLRNVLEYCKFKGFEPCVVVTDHYHDLPLLKAGLTNILVNPSDATLQQIRANNIEISRIIC